MKKLAVFASGKGTNMENICLYFKGSNQVVVSLICTNNRCSQVLKRAKKYNIPSIIFSKKDLEYSSFLENELKKYKIDFLILAGFLLKIPEKIIVLFKKKIINIHPTLLPKYGGKGMYGKNAHIEVLKNNEKESGITIHFVNNHYDKGEIIFQKSCSLSRNETLESLSSKIGFLEKSCFPKIIEKTILK